jgi:flagellar biosynthesis/type III secretory pathway protein FliH
MLNVLTILFYATSVYVVLWLTYKLGRYRAEEAMADEVARLRQSRWKEGYTIGRERGHKEGYRDGYAKGRAEGYEDGLAMKLSRIITRRRLNDN